MATFQPDAQTSTPRVTPSTSSAHSDPDRPLDFWDRRKEANIPHPASGGDFDILLGGLVIRFHIIGGCRFLCIVLLLLVLQLDLQWA